jgi:AraC-like DNA-binding protein
MEYSYWHERPRSLRSGYGIHRITTARAWRFPEHGHRGFCELVCCVEGRFTNGVNGRAVEQRPGEVLLIRECDTHALAGERFVYVNIMFQPEWIRRLEYYTQFSGTAQTLLERPDVPRAVVPPPQQAAYRADLAALLAQADSETGRRLFASFLLGLVIEHLAPPAERPLPAGLPEWLGATLRRLEDRRAPLPSLQELVRRSGRCHEHFTREFARRLGTPPSLFLTRLRADRAAEMLITTNQKIAEISRLTGFENESYFYRVFQARKRMTPQEYRRAHGPRSIQRSAAGPASGQERQSREV